MNQEIQSMIAEFEVMDHIKKTLTSWLKEETDSGKNCFDTGSCGDVSDIIKDLAETKKACYEALYYKTVIEAMNEGIEPEYGEGSYGYNHRHMANGEFASAGKGHYVRGYKPGPYMNQMPYVDAYMNDPRFEERMGYNGKSGDVNTSRDGEIYDNYQNAKRHYQKSKSTKDKTKMEEHCMKYMENTLSNLRSMWEDVDPMLKARMKKDFEEEMTEILEGV